MTTKRRTSVAKHPGVYYREDVKGRRRYEITYTDSDGNRRWKTVPGYDNLDDAEAEREELRGRIRKGERVAPTKLTVAEWASEWLASQAELRPRTIERYRYALDEHVLPRIGRVRVSELTVDDVSWLIGEMRKGGLAPWTIRGNLTPLSKMMGRAARKGMIAGNPVAALEDGERPAAKGKPKRILEPDELERLFEAAEPPYRLLLKTGALAGLRLGEALGLQWRDVDFVEGTIHISKQLGRDGKLAEPKTPSSERDVDLVPAFAGEGSSFPQWGSAFVGELREHKLGSSFSRPTDFVFASAKGTGLDHRNATRRGLEPAMRKVRIEDLRNAGADDLADRVTDRKLTIDEAERLAHEQGFAIEQKPGLTYHHLRHLYGSLQLAAGETLVDVAELMGHADSAITAKVYAHQVARGARAERRRARVKAADVTPLETAGGERRQNEGAAEVATVAEIGSASGTRSPAVASGIA